MLVKLHPDKAHEEWNREMKKHEQKFEEEMARAKRDYLKKFDESKKMQFEQKNAAQRFERSSDVLKRVNLNFLSISGVEGHPRPNKYLAF